MNTHYFHNTCVCICPKKGIQLHACMYLCIYVITIMYMKRIYRLYPFFFSFSCRFITIEKEKKTLTTANTIQTELVWVSKSELFVKLTFNSNIRLRTHSAKLCAYSLTILAARN